MSAYARLDALGLALPGVPAPAASYAPWTETAGWIYTAGQLPVVDGQLSQVGRVDEDLTIDEAAAQARIAALNILAVLDAAAGLESVRLAKITVYVASSAAFSKQHLVANGASSLLAEVLGDRGRHARSAVGVLALPLNAPVEVDAVACRV